MANAPPSLSIRLLLLMAHRKYSLHYSLNWLAQQKTIQRGARGQGTRKGMPLLYTKRIAKPVYSRGGACPRPGTPPTLPQVHASGGIPLRVPWNDETA